MEHDYLIIGAGSAGATLAARLADAGRDVLLLEAGPDYRSAETPHAMQIPNPNPVIVEPDYAPYRYDSLTAARTAAQSAYTYWRGAGVGGSSAINGQIAIRGVPEDYDGWAATGATGWSFDDVLPSFNRLESDLRYGSAPWHGDDGPIPVYRAPMTRWGPVDLALAEAALATGYDWAPDHNAPGALGVSPYAINSRSGIRVSTNDAYLEPRRGLNNLTIRGGVLVDQLLFDGNRAVGVRCLAGDDSEEHRAATIILAAGAVHSPAILMRSGIGPRAVLAEAGVPQRLELPVGEGFQDHPVINVILPVRDDLAVEAAFRHTNCCIRYSSGLDAPPGDMMIVAMNRLGDSIGHRLGQAFGVDTAGLLGVWVNYCESRGDVRISTADPREHPAIAENMLATESDRRRLFDGWLRLREIMQDPAVRDVAAGAWLDREGTEPRSLDSFENFVPWALAHASDTQHASCSCRMGQPDDPATVVDPECRVVGIDGLRVIDASVMPFVTSANTNLTAIMIAEKMAASLR